MYPAALQKISTQTVDSSQVLDKCTRQKQPLIIKSITKIGTKTQIKTQNRFFPNKTTTSFQRFDHQRQFSPN